MKNVNNVLFIGGEAVPLRTESAMLPVVPKIACKPLFDVFVSNSLAQEADIGLNDFEHTRIIKEPFAVGVTNG